MDDYIKVVKKRNLGLTPLQKMAGQFVVTGVFIYYLMNFTDAGTGILIPFTGGFTNGSYIHLPWWLFIILCLSYFWERSMERFTDGLWPAFRDHRIGCSVFDSGWCGNRQRFVTGDCGGLPGSLLGFLLFNVYPARVFMGDTGSLALGGFVAATASMMNMQLFIVIFGLIYLIEVISVMIQVVYFKKTGGKRFFKMAPIHHHFELSGWPETKVVAVFSIVTAILCLIGFLAL